MFSFADATNSNRDFDPHGPVGPTAFWKVSDKILESREEVEALARADPAIPSWAVDDDLEYVEFEIDQEEEEDDEEDDEDSIDVENHNVPISESAEARA